MACILWQVMMRDAMMGKAVLWTDDESCYELLNKIWVGYLILQGGFLLEILGR